VTAGGCSIRPSQCAASTDPRSRATCRRTGSRRPVRLKYCSNFSRRLFRQGASALRPLFREPRLGRLRVDVEGSYGWWAVAVRASRPGPFSTVSGRAPPEAAGPAIAPLPRGGGEVEAGRAFAGRPTRPRVGRRRQVPERIAEPPFPSASRGQRAGTIPDRSVAGARDRLVALPRALPKDRPTHGRRAGRDARPEEPSPRDHRPGVSLLAGYHLLPGPSQRRVGPENPEARGAPADPGKKIPLPGPARSRATALRRRRRVAREAAGTRGARTPLANVNEGGETHGAAGTR
jgi:hypothetical protein